MPNVRIFKYIYVTLTPIWLPNIGGYGGVPPPFHHQACPLQSKIFESPHRFTHWIRSDAIAAAAILVGVVVVDSKICSSAQPHPVFYVDENKKEEIAG